MNYFETYNTETNKCMTLNKISKNFETRKIEMEFEIGEFDKTYYSDVDILSLASDTLQYHIINSIKADYERSKMKKL